MGFTIIAPDGIRYRTLEEDDTRAIWRACKYRPERPSLAFCDQLLSDQLEADGDCRVYVDGPVADRTFRLLATRYGEEVGLLTVAVAADGTAAIDVDPTDPDSAGEMEADVVAWVDLLGITEFGYSVYAGMPETPVAPRVLSVHLSG